MRLSRNARFAAPFVVAAVIGVGAAIPGLSSNTHANVPPISALALVDKVAHAHVDGLSGTMSLTSNLGLPPGVGALGAGPGSAGIDWASLLSGNHRFDVWLGGDDRQRVSLTRHLGETDIVRNGDKVWIYDSTSEKVTNLIVGPSGSHSSLQAVTSRLLDRFIPVTTAEVGPPVVVAGASCYTLRLVPRAGTAAARDTTVGRVDVAVDKVDGVPLRLSVYPKTPAAAPPTLVIGFVGSVNFGQPPASTFAAPHGVSQSTQSLPSLLGGSSSSPVPGQPAAIGGARLTGTPWAPIVVVSNVHFGVAEALVNLLTVPTHGVPGSPRALTSNVVNVLVYPDGRLVAGLATLEALSSAAGRP